MPNEIIQATNVEDAEMQILAIYRSRSIRLDEITQKKYESFDVSEREDSDNHLNLDRLGNGTRIVDLAYYKFLPKRETAYRIDLIDDKQHVKKQLYFISLPREDL